MKEEIWKDIPGYEGIYQVSDWGRVRSLDIFVPIRGGVQTRHGRVLVPYINIDGYRTVSLCKNKKKRTLRVCRLVAITFIFNQYNYPTVNHINEIKTDDRVENLEWCTVKYNLNYRNRRANATATRKRNKVGFKPVEQYDISGNLVAVYESTAAAARATGCGQGSISNNCLGRTKTAGGYKWKYLDGTDIVE